MVLPLLDASEELKTMRMSRRQFMRGVTATMGATFYADQAMSEDKRPSEHWIDIGPTVQQQIDNGPLVGNVTAIRSSV